MIDSELVILDIILDVSSDVLVSAGSLVSVSTLVNVSRDFDSWVSVSVCELSNISSESDTDILPLASEYCIHETIIATMINRKGNNITFLILSVVFIRRQTI